MKKITSYTSLLFVFCFFQTYAQDLIVKPGGEMIKAKIQNMDMENVFYKPFDNLDAENVSIKKTDIAQIRFENGKTEYFGQSAPVSERSMDETKQFIIEEINKHGFDPNTFKRKFVASFEGDYLRLTIMRRNGEDKFDSALYDFSNVYRFSGVDRRSDSVAYINIFVAYLYNPKRNHWKKDKITMLVDSDIKAESIFNALKHYNMLLLRKEKGDSKF